MTESLIAGLLAGYGIAMPVGAMSVLIITLSAQRSLRYGLAAALGVATADGLYALIALLGGTALARLIEPATVALQALAAVVLAVIAVRGLMSAVRKHRAEPPLDEPPAPAGPGGPAAVEPYAAPAGGGPAAAAGARTVAPPGTAVARSATHTYLGLVGLTLLNPVTIVYFAALVVGRQPGAGTIGTGMVFVCAAFAASVSWQVMLASGGAVLGRALTSARGRLLTAVVGNAVIIVLASKLAWTALT